MLRFIYILAIILYPSLAFSAAAEEVRLGAQRTEIYVPLLEGKRIALYSNHTGMVGNQHTLDLLLEHKLKVTAIFSPEHGFRGNADAGEQVSNTKDLKTGIPILSLYDGKEKRPSASSMGKFDVLVVDIQDVGLRFYTYYITMVQLMDACAIHNKEVIILDRPNPNGYYVDGPILEKKYKSGVGGLPIPVVHGMTLGELAQMCIGENWLPSKKHCKLQVVTCENYTHQTLYELPVPPSPNLPNMLSIYLYPSICLFEGTPLSLGRGTDLPFQVFGHPDLKDKYTFNFTPRSKAGAKNPPLLNQKCYGVDYSKLPLEKARQTKLDLNPVIEAYQAMKGDAKFFKPFFNLLIGVGYVKQMIVDGKSATQIESMWAEDVKSFRAQRKPYLLYPDNEL